MRIQKIDKRFRNFACKIYNFIIKLASVKTQVFITLLCYGSLVKRLRRCPLTAETGVRFPYELLHLQEEARGFFF